MAALATVLVLALPVAAGAQFMDPVLEQYAPSSQQIDNKVKGDKEDGADGGGGESDATAGQPGAAGGSGVGADGDTDGGGGSGAGGAGGSSGGGGDDTGRGAGGDGDPAPGEGAATQSGGDASGLDARLLADVPVTWFDFLALALATATLIGTALLLRRASRSPRVEG
jgi:hypothetical protein